MLLQATLALKTTQLTTRSTPLDRLTHEEEMYSLTLIDSLQLGARDKHACGGSGREFARFCRNRPKTHLKTVNRSACIAQSILLCDVLLLMCA